MPLFGQYDTTIYCLNHEKNLFDKLQNPPQNQQLPIFKNTILAQTPYGKAN